MNNEVITKIDGCDGQYGVINYLLQINNYYGGVFIRGDEEGIEFDNYNLILYSSEFNRQYISFSYSKDRTEDEDYGTYCFKYNDSRIPVVEQLGEIKLFYNDIVKYTFDEINIDFFLKEAERIIKLHWPWNDDLMVLKIENERIKEFYQSVATDEELKSDIETIKYFYGSKEIFNLRFYGSSSLNLTDCGLEKLPDSMKNLEQIESIIIEDNYLQDGIEEITTLHYLKKLELFQNMISELPEDIDALKELEELIIDERFIYSIPEEIGQLKKLKKLTIRNTSIAKLPESICNLSSLEELIVAENRNIKKIPDCIARLQNLTHLYLYNNNIELLPDEIGELDNLRVLNVSRNRLYYIPKRFSMLSKLEKLDVSNNRLKFLEKDLFDIDSLIEINIKGNLYFDVDELYTIILSKKLNNKLNLIT